MTATAQAELLKGRSPFDSDYNASVLEMLNRYLHGDWGNLCDEDKRANNNAIQDGSRILGKYEIDGTDLYVITEAVESADTPRYLTTILLPSDY